MAGRVALGSFAAHAHQLGGLRSTDCERRRPSVRSCPRPPSWSQSMESHDRTVGVDGGLVAGRVPLGSFAAHAHQLGGLRLGYGRPSEQCSKSQDDKQHCGFGSPHEASSHRTKPTHRTLCEGKRRQGTAAFIVSPRRWVRKPLGTGLAPTPEDARGLPRRTGARTPCEVRAPAVLVGWCVALESPTASRSPQS